MPALKNAKHEAFAQGMFAGKCGREAYRTAGYDCTPEAADAAASRLLKDVRVSARVNELRERVANKAVKSAALTKEWVLERLMKHAEICLGGEKIKTVRAVKSRTKDESGGFQDQIATVEVEVTERDAAAANRALELLGRERGMFVERKEIGDPGAFDEVSDDELENRLKALSRRTHRSPSDRGRIDAPEEPESLH